jgi:hypothetical protein
LFLIGNGSSRVGERWRVKAGRAPVRLLRFWWKEI